MRGWLPGAMGVAWSWPLRAMGWRALRSEGPMSSVGGRDDQMLFVAGTI